ncbi:hypothetical protein [uncultured Jatrophihabitans sp.]|uniref:hypothetical protein n=1 Tax=uncultured Jatrophihabitans sp. TaxID=1610747 RepID=UPI0035CBC4AA
MIESEPGAAAALEDAGTPGRWVSRQYLALSLMIGFILLLVVGGVLLMNSAASAAGGCGGG